MSKICFDLSYFLVLLKKSGISLEENLLIKSRNLKDFVIRESFLGKNDNENSEKSFWEILLQENISLFLRVISILIALISLRIFKEKLIKFTLEKLYSKYFTEISLELPLDENLINTYINFPSVKLHLFFKEDSYFKKKYGNNFNPDYYDNVLLQKEFLELLKKQSDSLLNNLIIQSIKNIYELRITFVINIFSFFFLFSFFVNFCLLLNQIEIHFGFLKTFLILFAILFGFFVVFIFLKIVLKVDKKNEKSSQEGSLEEEDSESDSSLIVVERKNFI